MTFFPMRWKRRTADFLVSGLLGNKGAKHLASLPEISGAGGASHPWAPDRDVTYIDGVRQ